jgi:DNA polymerase-3 subunit gamma/tau
LPDPGELARMIQNGAPLSVAAPVAPVAAPAGASAEATLPATIEDVVALLERTQNIGLSLRIRHHASLVSLSGSDLVLSSARPLPSDLVGELATALKSATGRNWKITTAETPGAPTLRELDAVQYESFKAEILASPMFRAALDAFPGAEIADSEIESLMKQRSKSA